MYLIFGLASLLSDSILTWVGAGIPDLGATNASQRIQNSAGQSALREYGISNIVTGSLGSS